MRLVSIALHNYRGIADAVLTYPPGNCAVLFGVNGRGKTTVLDAVAAMLVPYVNTLCSFPAAKEDSAISGEPEPENDAAEIDLSVIKATDVRNGTTASACTITVGFSGADPEGRESWKAARNRVGARDEMTLDFNEGYAPTIAEYFQGQVVADIHAGTSVHNIPIVVYYPTERTIIDIPLRIRKRHDFSHQLAALEGALQRRSQDYKVFFEWFRNREDLENERRLDLDPEYRDRELEAVRRAVPAMLQEWGDLRIKRNPLRMEVRKGSEVLQVDQLSHGEKCVMVLFADLARRLAIANPTLEDPLAGEAIVLIDEIELHLHPGWQRRIVGALTSTFSNCQFLLSTHSPQVLSEVRNEQILLLEQDAGGQVKLYPGLPVYGRDSNQILDVVMDVAERPEGVRDRIRAVYDQIAGGAFEEARRSLAAIEAEIGADEPELTRLRTLLTAKELS